jgi:hypothetical protein
MPIDYFNIKSIYKILLFEFAVEFVSLMRISVHFLLIAFVVSFWFILMFIFLVFPLQEPAAHHNTCLDIISHNPCRWKSCGYGESCERIDLDY